MISLLIFTVKFVSGGGQDAYYRSAPSVIRQAEATKKAPEFSYREITLNGSSDRSDQLLRLPRNARQIANAKIKNLNLKKPS